MTDTKKLDAITLDGGKALKRYIEIVRDINKELYLEVMFAADELRGALSATPVPDAGHLGGMSSAVHARRVAALLKRSADANKFAAREGIRAWKQFERIWLPDSARSSKKPKFDPTR